MPDAAVVLLTGSTGNLGSHILASLLLCPWVSKVFTLDRGTSPREKLKASFKDRGLVLDLLQSEKLVTLTGDLTKSNLRLDIQVLQQVNIRFPLHNYPDQDDLAGPRFCHSYHPQRLESRLQPIHQLVRNSRSRDTKTWSISAPHALTP